jgi:hypothetical protein
MQSVKRPGRSVPKRLKSVSEPEPEGVEPDDEFDAYDTFEMYRVVCPDCAQPIALLADEEVLPEHALCASPRASTGARSPSPTSEARAPARSASRRCAERPPDRRTAAGTEPGAARTGEVTRTGPVVDTRANVRGGDPAVRSRVCPV